jgi:hypothetical protein
MKLLFYILFICFFLSSLALCEKSPVKESPGKTTFNVAGLVAKDSINLKAIVQVQIDSAKARDARGEVKSQINYYESVLAKTSESGIGISWMKLKVDSFFSSKTNLKLLIIAGFSILVFFTVFIRRTLRRHKVSSRKKLKENISLIRKESKIKKEDPELDFIRSGLINEADSNVMVNSISTKAKELRIAKGEIMLAAKIKSFQLAQLGSHNK